MQRKFSTKSAAYAISAVRPIGMRVSKRKPPSAAKRFLCFSTRQKLSVANSFARDIFSTCTIATIFFYLISISVLRDKRKS